MSTSKDSNSINFSNEKFSNLNNFKHFELKSSDLKNLNKDKTSRALYEYLFEANSSFALINKENFINNMKNSFEKILENNGIFTCEDIIILITKKMFDLMSENKTLHDGECKML